MGKVITPEELRHQLVREGITFKQYCERKGVAASDYRVAVLVVNGFSKAKYGRSHTTAVKLGLKAAA